MPPKGKKSSKNEEPKDEILCEDIDESMPELDLVDKDTSSKRKYLQPVSDQDRAVLSKYGATLILSYLHELGDSEDCPNWELKNGAYKTLRDMHEGRRFRQNKSRQTNQRQRSRSRGPAPRSNDWGEPIQRESRSRSRERNPY